MKVRRFTFKAEHTVEFTEEDWDPPEPQYLENLTTEDAWSALLDTLHRNIEWEIVEDTGVVET